MAKIHGYVDLTVRFAREGRRWTAECLELGTAAYGDTLQEAQDAIADLVALHLNSLEDVHSREAFFKKHRIRMRLGAPKPAITRVPVRLGEFVSRFTSPLHLASGVR